MFRVYTSIGYSSIIISHINLEARLRNVAIVSIALLLHASLTIADVAAVAQIEINPTVPVKQKKFSYIANFFLSPLDVSGNLQSAYFPKLPFIGHMMYTKNCMIWHGVCGRSKRLRYN